MGPILCLLRQNDVASRGKIPPIIRTALLIANQHACCICGESGVQIHHIDGDLSNNDLENLASLCLKHHDEATAPQGLTAKLTPWEISQYKRRWETSCVNRLQKGVRGCTAFFMVDYTNAIRIRALFSQLSPDEYKNAYQILSYQLREETELRQAQGFNVSIEPNLKWSTPVETLIPYVLSGDAHPAIFNGLKGHPSDPLFPCVPAFADHRVAYYDIWCQLMVRALVAIRSPFLLLDLLRLPDPLDCGLEGKLCAFEGRLSGNVAYPAQWKENQLSDTTLTVSINRGTINVNLKLKTYYVYSETAAESLGAGRGCGLLLLRSVDTVEENGNKKTITVSATPLIIGSGGGGILQIP